MVLEVKLLLYVSLALQLKLINALVYLCLFDLLRNGRHFFAFCLLHCRFFWFLCQLNATVEDVLATEGEDGGDAQVLTHLPALNLENVCDALPAKMTALGSLGEFECALEADTSVPAVHEHSICICTETNLAFGGFIFFFLFDSVHFEQHIGW